MTMITTALTTALTAANLNRPDSVAPRSVPQKETR
jgi:hypothetical protein